MHLKLGWAEEHLRRLDAEVLAYEQSRPYVPAIQPHAEPEFPTEDDWVAYTIVASAVRPIPPAIYLTAGDAIHNLRAALDYLAWQLVALSNLPPGKRTEFPVRWDPPDKRDANGVAVMMTPQPRVDIARLLDIQWLQPYHGQGGDRFLHPLYVLHDLDRIDKHRHLTVLAAVAGAGRVTVLFPDGRTWEQRHRGVYQRRAGEWWRYRLQDGAPLGSIPHSVALEVLAREMQVDCELDIQVTLGEPRPHNRPLIPIGAEIRDLLSFVRSRVVPLFASLF